MGGSTRNLGIYRLPDNTELVAKFEIGGELRFYTLENFVKEGRAEYQMDKDYNLLKNGKPTGLSRWDMNWTGRDAWEVLIGEPDS
jgi:hypothetical protein